MRASTPIVTVWRIVLEALAPLSIATGWDDGVRDTVLAADANGLPCLPATSLAGVLRAAVRAVHGEPAERALFGYVDSRRGQASRLDVGHGTIHDSHDRPLDGLRAQPDDPLLARLRTRAPVTRRRVRIDHRGAADDTGLFDRSVLPAGHRFSVELRLWSPGADVAPDARRAPPAEAAWLEACLADGGLRVGGLTRSGLGRLGVVRAHRRVLDLRDAGDRAVFAALVAEPRATDGLEVVDLVGGMPGAPRHGSTDPARPGRRRITVRLRPEAGVRFGGGSRGLQARASVAKPADDLPQTEPRVRWDGGRGRLEHDDEVAMLVPAASVKGALSHRVAFHAARLAGRWAESGATDRWDKAVRCPTVRRLFGHADAERDGGARAGLVWLSDVFVDRRSVVACTRMHTSLDRFTGGVRDGLLFAAEDVHARDARATLFTLELDIDVARAERLGVTADDWQALDMALGDLAGGRLALGADGSGGVGWMRGDVRWDGDGHAPHATPVAASAAIQGETS